MAISLTVLEEELVRELRIRLDLPLDDIVEVMRRYRFEIVDPPTAKDGGVQSDNPQPR